MKDKFYSWRSAAHCFRIMPPTKFIGKIDLYFAEKIMKANGLNWKSILAEHGVDISEYPHFTIPEENLSISTKLVKILNKNLKNLERR